MTTKRNPSRTIAKRLLLVSFIAILLSLVTLSAGLLLVSAAPDAERYQTNPEVLELLESQREHRLPGERR